MKFSYLWTWIEEKPNTLASPQPKSNPLTTEEHLKIMYLMYLQGWVDIRPLAYTLVTKKEVDYVHDHWVRNNVLHSSPYWYGPIQGLVIDEHWKSNIPPIHRTPIPLCTYPLSYIQPMLETVRWEITFGSSILLKKQNRSVAAPTPFKVIMDQLITIFWILKQYSPS